MKGSKVVWSQPPALPTTSWICRVGQSGGKDRHIKVYTTCRNVQQDHRVAYQSCPIEKLPELDPTAFATVPVPDPTEPKVKQQSKSGSSSTSKTSKGSELSLSRSDNRASASRDREVTVASTSTQATSFNELLIGSPTTGVPHPMKGANSLGACLSCPHRRQVRQDQGALSAVLLCASPAAHHPSPLDLRRGRRGCRRARLGVRRRASAGGGAACEDGRRASAG